MSKKDKIIKQEDFDKLQTELNEVKEMSLQLDSQLKRAVADYHNLEKRINDGRSELTAYATTDLIRKLIPVLDNFERVTGGVSEQEKQSAWYKGTEMAVKQLSQVLEGEGLTQIEVEGTFDPSLHEAVDSREGEDNIILEVLEQGYRLNGKILKPAKVIVGKKGEN